MPRTTYMTVACLLVSLSSLTTAPAFAEDWPSYRGPGGDGISKESGFSTKWPVDGPAIAWRQPIGNGYSGITVSSDRVFTQFGITGNEYLAAFAAETGAELWRYAIDKDRYDNQGSGPRSTPAVDGGVVYAASANGKLHAVEAESGKALWSHYLVTEYGARVPQWGVSASPVVVGDLVLMEAGGKKDHSLLAFDKKTGELKWHSHTDSPGYSTPLVMNFEGRETALFFTASGLVGVATSDGQVLFEYPWQTSYDVNAAMPVFLPPDKVFISSNYDKGAALLRLAADEGRIKLTELWKSRVMRNHFNTSVLVGDYLYGFDNATLKCIQASTGEEKWGERSFGKGSLLYADGHLYVLSERGLLLLVEATPDGYRELGRTQALTGKTWTMPSLADGRLFVRNERELIAFKIN